MDLTDRKGVIREEVRFCFVTLDVELWLCALLQAWTFSGI